MRIFIYKILIFIISFYIVFQLTFGLLIKEFKKNLYEFSSKENILIIKDKIREELKDGLKKDRILNTSDAELIKMFLRKISSELKM
tara:strand:+ start:860 stop:1117 length:258 start_codon:yes stop_codon:yes gene_type:complete